MLQSYEKKEGNLVQITLTQTAIERLKRTAGGRTGVFRIVYDTDGCGCAVNGVPALWYADAPESDDVSIESTGSEDLSFWVDRKQTIFFEDELKLDNRPESGGLRLYSDSQIYNASLQVFDRTASAAK
jgi:uncharacterized protein YqkB